MTDLVACATGDNITQDYSNLILVNKSDATLDASTGTLDLKLSSVQSKEYINSNIACSVDNKVLTVNTKNINPDFVNKRSDLQVNLIASYTTTENIEIKTEHAINLHINPQNDIVAYSTITLEGGSSISVSTANTEPTHTGVRFDSKLWNSTNALLAGKKPIFEYSVPEGESLPENLEISFDENNEMIVDATNVGHIGKQTFNLTVTCKKYLDNGQEKVITEESKAEQVQIGFTITDNANYIVTTDDQTIDLTPLIDPNEFCTVLSAGVHYVYVTPKDGGEKVGIKATNIKQVSITNCNTSTEKRMINTNFLYSCSNLTSIDLTGLSNVKTIGNNFLYGCNALQTIDLSPLICVTQIGSSFLANCNKLISNDENKLDLTGLKNVASIADSFMAGCSKVDYLDFRPLTKIKTESAISGSFLSGCDNLTRVNMGTISSRCLQKSSQSFATSVAGVPMYLTGITLISTADTEGYRDKFPDSTISPYRKLNIELSANRIIYDGIGYDLSDDLDPSKAFCGDLLFEIPLKDQTDPLGSLVVTELTKFKITSITITKVKSGIVSIDDNFLKDCSGLETIDLSGLKDIVSVGQNFLSGCSKLNEIDLSPMTSLAHVGTGFANKCANLTELNIGSLKATYFDNSEYTLAHSSVYDRGYGAGTLVVGDDKDKFVSIFKELKSSSSYRYLITDSTMNFINLSDGTRIQLAQEFNINTLCGTSNSNSSYQVSVPLKVDGKSVVRSIRLGEIYDLSVRDPAIIYGISNCFMKHAELLRNIYISELNTIGSIGREFCAYCYNLRSMNFEMFPNIKTIDGNYFMHKNSSLRNMDFSVLNDRGKNLQFTGNSGPLVDCYNLMMINFGAIQLGNLALSANAAFGIRNQFEAPAYILGRAFVGDNASDLINKFKPRLWIEETKGEDSVKITDHFMCFHINVNARLWLWNSREYNPLIDDIIDELIEKLPV